MCHFNKLINNAAVTLLVVAAKNSSHFDEMFKTVKMEESC